MATTLNGPKWTTAKVTGLAMRISMAVNLAVGVILIVVGVKLENPPAHYPSIIFIVTGALNLLATLLGLWGSYHKKRILGFFLMVEGVSVLIQLVFFFLLLFKFGNVVDAIVIISNGVDEVRLRQVTPIPTLHTLVTMECLQACSAPCSPSVAFLT